jgi:leucyl aminopeptidase
MLDFAAALAIFLSDSNSYNNRHYRSTTGTQAATWLFNQVTTIARANTAITVRRFTHSFNQPSVIARIPGRSSNLGMIFVPLLDFFY